MYDDPRPLPKNKFIYRTDHLNNTYLSSVLLGGNGPAVPENKGGRLYSDCERPYVKLQVTALDVGGKAVVWQERQRRTDRQGRMPELPWQRLHRLAAPRVTEMKLIMMWAVFNRNQMGRFLGKTDATLEKEDAKPYWTATEADMGTQNEVDESETAWYVQGYYSKLGGGKRNYKVATRNKQEAAFIRCVREM